MLPILCAPFGLAAVPIVVGGQLVVRGFLSRYCSHAARLDELDVATRRSVAEELARVGELARGVGAKVVVDEVYLDALEGVDRSPVATRDPVFVSTNSLTKSYGLAGIRVGWLLADPETVERSLRARDVVDAVGSIPSETIGVLAFERLDELLERAHAVLAGGQERVRPFIEDPPKPGDEPGL